MYGLDNKLCHPGREKNKYLKPSKIIPKVGNQAN